MIPTPGSGNRSAKKITDHTVKDATSRMMNRIHRLILTVSGNKLLTKPYGMTVVELHTVGRKSGLARSCYLTTPIRDSGRVVLVASKGGDDRNPDWYLNLCAHPDAELSIDGVRHKIRARTATAEERAELWPRIVASYRGYANYQRRTERVIPVVICELERG